MEGRLAGALLLFGSTLLVFAGILFGVGADQSTSLQRWQSNALSTGLVVTLLGIAVFEFKLRDAGERVLARLGTISFLVGTTLWIAGDAIALSGASFVFEFERDYVVLACVTVAALGAAIVRTRILPGGLGWMAIAWGISWASLYLTRVVEAPLGPNVMTFLFGLLLVRR